MTREVVFHKTAYGYNADCVVDGLEYSLAIIYQAGKNRLMVGHISATAQGKPVFVSSLDEVKQIVQKWADAASDDDFRSHFGKELTNETLRSRSHLH